MKRRMHRALLGSSRGHVFRGIVKTLAEFGHGLLGTGRVQCTVSIHLARACAGVVAGRAQDAALMLGLESR